MWLDIGRNNSRWERSVYSHWGQAYSSTKSGVPVRAESPLARLSPHEREILQLVVEGKPSAEIARILRISPKTAETHSSRLMKKLGVRNLIGLIKFSMRYGLTPVKDKDSISTNTASWWASPDAEAGPMRDLPTKKPIFVRVFPTLKNTYFPHKKYILSLQTNGESCVIVKVSVSPGALTV